MIPVIVIRPQPGCDATLAAARDLGLDAKGFPLFRVEPVEWDAPDPASFDALLIGSANALRHAGPALAAYAGKPAYAVGETTAEAARAAGFTLAAVGSGGLQAVLDDVTHERLLRLAGRERIALAPPACVKMTERVVYASAPCPVPPALTELLARPAVILLHSAQAARHFAAECLDRGIDRSRLSLVAIGPRVAEAAGGGWRTLAVAQATQDAAVLAQAKRLCQEANGSP